MKGLRWTELSMERKKHFILLGTLTFLGVLLLSMGGQEKTQVSPEVEIAQPQTIDSGQAAVQLEEILSQVEGAGKVLVQINYKTKEETSYATDQKIRRQESEGAVSEEREETIAFYNSGQGSEKALVIAQKEAEIAGILIVAEGAGDAEIKRQLIQAAAVLFDIPEYKVSVLKMKGGDR